MKTREKPTEKKEATRRLPLEPRNLLISVSLHKDKPKHTKKTKKETTRMKEK